MAARTTRCSVSAIKCPPPTPSPIWSSRAPAHPASPRSRSPGSRRFWCPIPYAADDHQTRNAEVFAEAGAAELVQERDLDAEKLAAMATSILRDLPTYKRMAKAARALAIPDAAERVCAAIEATLQPS
jgi:hypothetical protein